MSTETPKAELRPHELSVDLFSKRNNKTTQLVNNSDPDLFVEGKKRWFEYEFEAPVYITEISIQASGYSSWHGVEFEVQHMDGTQHIEKIGFDQNVITLGVGKLASGFRFKPDQRYSVLTSQLILKVVVTGLTLQEFHQFEWAIKEFDKKSADLNAKQTNYDALVSNIASLNQEKSDLDAEIGKSRAEAETLATQNTKLLDQIQTAKVKLQEIKDEVVPFRDEKSQLTKEIASAKQKLTELTKELRVFPSEIAGFVREGRRAILHFTLMSLPFVVILGYVTSALFSSAIDLTQLWRTDETIDIWTVFLSRLPFVVVAIAVLEVCGYIIGRFITEVIRINRQRLSLSRLSIIAKDVTVSASVGEDISEDQAYEREVALKMELLRGHMKDDVGEDFQYSGTAAQTIVKALARRVGGQKGNAD